jgi:hypothetical protein
VDEGYSIQSFGMGLRYQEGDHVCLVGGEPSSPWMYYLAKLRWQPPHFDEPMSAETEQRVRQRALDWLRDQNLPFMTDIPG